MMDPPMPSMPPRAPAASPRISRVSNSCHGTGPVYGHAAEAWESSLQRPAHPFDMEKLTQSSTAAHASPLRALWDGMAALFLLAISVEV